MKSLEAQGQQIVKLVDGQFIPTGILRCFILIAAIKIIRKIIITIVDTIKILLNSTQ